MKTVLFAVYVNIFGLVGPHHTFIWREYQVAPNGDPEYEQLAPARHIVRFLNLAICEKYRGKIVAAWLADPSVPFHKQDVVSSRCGPWVPDPETGSDL